MRKDQAEYMKYVAYLGCEVPRGFLLRFQAMKEVRGDDKGALLAGALEDEIERWEKRLSDKDAQTYKSLMELKAKQNGLYLKDLTAPLEIKRTKKGTRILGKPRPVSWPKLKKV
jgi:hypothetical protein